jgi:hypothetical protein
MAMHAAVYVLLAKPQPETFRFEELTLLPRHEADDPKLYPRVGTVTWQPGLGVGLILSRATRSRAIYRVKFGHDVRYILFAEDEPEDRV